MTMDIKALIFQAGQPDQFGRTWPLAVYATTRTHRSICLARNVSPHVQAVQAQLDSAERSEMTNVHVSYDSCG
ncbi:hypothetical protein [Mycolicibacterium houstonense]|uniref:hypothetical protein n=1 Tax=Mycolicibacterium houstonense TaxID=146021 RepID=UPI003F97246D